MAIWSTLHLACPAQERTATKDDRRIIINPNETRYNISNEISGTREPVVKSNPDNRSAGKGTFESDALTQVRQAAERGDAQAQYNLGVAYFKGKGAQKDYAEAAKWSLKAAEQGNAKAQYNMGVAYFHGDGVNKSYNEGVKWFRKAAENNNVKAQYYLGMAYSQGRGVEKMKQMR